MFVKSVEALSLVCLSQEWSYDTLNDANLAALTMKGFTERDRFSIKASAVAECYKKVKDRPLSDGAGGTVQAVDVYPDDVNNNFVPAGGYGNLIALVPSKIKIAGTNWSGTTDAALAKSDYEKIMGDYQTPDPAPYGPYVQMPGAIKSPFPRPPLNGATSTLMTMSRRGMMAKIYLYDALDHIAYGEACRRWCMSVHLTFCGDDVCLQCVLFSIWYKIPPMYPFLFCLLLAP